MKNLEKYQDIVNELKEVCDKHGVALLGTCESEGIYGEISIVESKEPESNTWGGAKKFCDNTVRIDTPYLYVNGIGTICYDD